MGETSRRHRQFFIFLGRVTLYTWSYYKFDEEYLYYTHEGSWCGKNITTLITTLAYQTVEELGTLAYRVEGVPLCYNHTEFGLV